MNKLIVNYYGSTVAFSEDERKLVDRKVLADKIDIADYGFVAKEDVEIVTKGEPVVVKKGEVVLLCRDFIKDEHGCIIEHISAPVVIPAGEIADKLKQFIEK